jgi:hypothetical protein
MLSDPDGPVVIGRIELGVIGAPGCGLEDPVDLAQPGGGKAQCDNLTNSHRLRRAEVGIHHHIAGAYLLRYAQESSWREDNRRVSNGDQVNRVAALAMKRGKSVDFTGYWQRHVQ